MAILCSSALLRDIYFQKKKKKIEKKLIISAFTQLLSERLSKTLYRAANDKPRALPMCNNQIYSICSCHKHFYSCQFICAGINRVRKAGQGHLFKEPGGLSGWNPHSNFSSKAQGSSWWCNLKFSLQTQHFGSNPALEMMLDVPGALFGQALKIPAQNQQGKDSKHGGGAVHSLGFGQGMLPGMTNCEALGQGRRKSPQCNVVAKLSPGSPELNWDFREIHGNFNAQTRA